MFFSCAPGLERQCGALAQRLMIAVCIEEFALIVRAQQTLVRVLAVNIDQIFADLAQLRQGHSRAVHVGATAALGVDDPAQHQFVLSL